MKRLYINAKVIFENNICKQNIYTENGKIIAPENNFTADETINCNGLYLSPGFADIHVHGGGGYSAMSQNPEDIVNMCSAHAHFGTTSIVPTTLASQVERLKQSIKCIEEAKKMCTNSNILGVHLEGPFISMGMKGAQSPQNIIYPDADSVCSLLDSSENIIMIGAAPEVSFIVGEEAKKRGIVASVAHSNADYSIAEQALEHGFSDVTHIFSACSAMHKEGIFRKVGVAEAGLSLDGYTTQFIGDLRHLPYGAIKLIYAAKGADKAYAITDGLEYSAMNMKDGTVITQENGLKVIFEDSVMKLYDRSCLAGSVATMNVIVKNMVKVCGISLNDAVKMASLTPLKVAGFADKKGKIEAGYDEDLIMFDDDINVKYVCVNGKKVLS